MPDKTSFIKKLKSTFELTPLELTLKTSFNKPIVNLGELVSDYIDRKGSSYSTEKLLKILNPLKSMEAYHGSNRETLNDDQYKNNIRLMGDSIRRLVNQPHYLEKMKDLVEANNKQAAEKTSPSILGHKFSSIEYIAEEIEWLNPEEASKKESLRNEALRKRNTI